MATAQASSGRTRQEVRSGWIAPRTGGYSAKPSSTPAQAERADPPAGPGASSGPKRGSEGSK